MRPNILESGSVFADGLHRFSRLVLCLASVDAKQLKYITIRRGSLKMYETKNIILVFENNLVLKLLC